MRVKRFRFAASAGKPAKARARNKSKCTNHKCQFCERDWRFRPTAQWRAVNTPGMLLQWHWRKHPRAFSLFLSLRAPGGGVAKFSFFDISEKKFLH